MPKKKYKPWQIVMLSAASFFLAFAVSVSRPLLALIVDGGRKAEETSDQYTGKNLSDNIRLILRVFRFFVCTNLLRPKSWGESPPDALLVRMDKADGPVPEEGPGKPGLNSSGAGQVQESPVKSKRFVSELI